jgi:hypothetical protein
MEKEGKQIPSQIQREHGANQLDKTQAEPASRQRDGMLPGYKKK